MAEHTVGTVALPVDVEYTNSTLVTHALLGDADDLAVVLAERDALHRGGELPAEEALARLHRPEAHRVVGRAGDEVLGGACFAVRRMPSTGPK